VTAQLSPDLVARFTRQRPFLRSLAYQMLGSVCEAEDVVQDAWLRWCSRDCSDVTHPRAYLMQVTTRLVLDRLETARARREVYTGSWLPEPFISAPDVADEVAESDTVSVAMLIVLETLSPLERVVFVLREAFGFRYTEIAEATGRTDEAVRQLARRARSNVKERRRRFVPGRAEHRAVCEKFLAACSGGDLAALTAVLAPEVTLVADSGGSISAPLRPLESAGKVARFLMSVIERQPGGVRLRYATINAGPGVIAYCGSPPAVLGTAAFEISGDGIARIYAVFNPAKLSHLTVPDDVTFSLPRPV
jgi:RNA polymerase sigma-70 factor, ECF subfamily